MPPKKKTTYTTDATISEAGETKFGWTPENDRALLILTFGRNPTTEDYQKFVTALPAGASYNGVKIRCSKLRMEMKKRYEKLGWEVLDTAPAKAKGSAGAGAASKKRKAADDGDGNGDGAADADAEETPVTSKKPRAKKGEAKKGEAKKKKGVKSEEVVVEDEEGEVGREEGGAKGEVEVKAEVKAEAEVET
ncbi:hypothetical protein N0V94_006991 [Neodidymelliopsis sp. IMI 364377]|nr:hypothetical protein N0V94_006991 [Neodidymelliopsis sp. IMI 364377]